VRADVSSSQGIDRTNPLKNYDHGISVHLKCNNDPHLVQFVYREFIQPSSATVPPGAEPNPYGKLLDNESLKYPCCSTSWRSTFDKIVAQVTEVTGIPYPIIQYPITTDLNDIHWHPDAPTKPSPYYDAGHSVELDCDSLALFDRPQMPTDDFDLALKRVSRLVARDYAICGGQVKAQVTWISDQTVDSQQQSHFTYQAKVSPATTIPDYFLCLLKNNGYDPPTGQTITPGFDCANLGKASVGKP
jgi:hypothetical protein